MQAPEQRRIWLGRFGYFVDGYAVGTLVAESIAIYHQLGYDIILDCHGVGVLGTEVVRGIKAELTSQALALGFDLRSVRIAIDRAYPHIASQLVKALGADGMDPPERLGPPRFGYYASSRLQGVIEMETERMQREALEKERSECMDSFAISY